MFATPVSYDASSGSIPSGVAVGDFNGDGKIDIVTTNYLANNIGIFLNHGDGTFATQVPYDTGSGSTPPHVALGDFNGDGKIDIVTANFGTVNIGIFLNHGDGTFATQVTYTTGSGSTPYGIAVADFNGDGKIDVVTANYRANSITILLNNGDGTFPTQVIYTTGSGTLPIGVTVGDFNGDGKIDIVTANGGTNNIGVFINNGAGTFATLVTYDAGSGSRPGTPAVGDFNGDGKIDIVSANSGTANIGVFINNGAGTFATQVTYTTGSGSTPYGIAVADFNGDGKIDIVTANGVTDNIETFLNNGAGTFAIQVTYDADSGSASYAIAVGDFNGDGKIDIVSTNRDTSSIDVFLQVNV
ncbi:unnamed protein product [Adineta steineri]|uniref:Uncharacterized protein n=1 Tax=Adineta steineri TaxID=433720 RepID=A0A819GLN8_9BILA|nr:unnamed protein product [Adineta steineri]CAF1041023.1 unnamed protein product [Adineta steineri]CAF1069391.1 unnamed protein product [Adineta steineri]CAF3772989.1 unnamed protein product [Adineta steineri]CAF3885490.1 unnamed protein product [Adineta steineri]